MDLFGFVSTRDSVAFSKDEVGAQGREDGKGGREVPGQNKKREGQIQGKLRWLRHL